ncbi:hypothetical protein EDD15DRAFT_2514757 [Pisolithus albus]|nr:hypothetical protein EDD15DRAFT_2514757 [Pisolithus albus]
MSTLELNCYMLGGDPSSIFMVEILKTENVDTLKALIKAKQSPVLDHVPAPELMVWRVSLPDESVTPELTLDDAHAQELCGLEKISSVFGEAPVDEYVHILVRAPQLLSLNCVFLLVNENRPFKVGISKVDCSRFFTIKILNTASVSALQSLIKAERSPFLNHVPPSWLTLQKVSLPMDMDTPELIVYDARTLHPLEKISSIFGGALVEKYIHILVEVPFERCQFLPTVVIPQKRELPTSEDLYERAKRSKIVKNLPLITAQPEVFESLQKDLSEKILDDRPKPDPDVAPTPLLYEGFGHFLDIMDGRLDVPGLADIDTTKLLSKVDEFASKMNKDYPNEDFRREAVLPYLNRIFKARRGIEIPPLHAPAIGSVRSGVHNDAPHGTGTMVVVFRNSLAGIDAIPEVELTGYVAHLNVKGIHRKLYLGWRVPCLGLIIVGHMLQFYAVIAVDRRFKLVSLTSMYSCIETAFDGRDRKSLYLAFTAASVLQAQLLHDIEKLFNNPPSELPIRKRGFPAVSKLRKYPPSDDHLHFEIQSFLEDRQSYRLLYVAETQRGQSVLIKFTRRYSIQLHETCARLGHAPQILAFERLPGGWYAVAMEYIESGVSINRSTQLATHGDRWEKELRALVDKFHSEGLVHGDLRDANMLCEEDSVMLIDFDWGGIDGEVSYPTGNLNNELLEGRVSSDLRITKEDDKRILERTLEKLRNIEDVPETSPCCILWC